MVKVRIFFFYFRGSFKCLIVILPSYTRTDDPRRRRAFIVILNIEVFIHSCEQCGHFFFTRHQFPLPANLHRHSRRPHFQQDETCCLLDRRRHESPASNVQLVPACVASGNMHNAVFHHLDKNRAKQRRTVFSMNKAQDWQESKQQSMNWRRRHLGHVQQQPHRRPGFDKCVEMKLRLDIYIRPWSPAWSFLRHIYTSRGSERVNAMNQDLSDIACIAKDEEVERNGFLSVLVLFQTTSSKYLMLPLTAKCLH